MLSHFYGFLLFTNPVIDNYFKRFVRDFLHYTDSIYCAAGKIVNALQEEGKALGFEEDEEGGGGYSSFHVRRGDLQYKRVKISAEEWYESTKELWEPSEILYIATDERNKTFFDPIKEHHSLRFLDDYWEMAGLAELDPNYMGMIDTIVASRGRNFVGTYFSTFTGYITRMRGYYGMSSKTSYYGLMKYKFVMHTWFQGPFHIFAHEWPTGWVGIDGDVIPSEEKFWDSCCWIEFGHKYCCDACQISIFKLLHKIACYNMYSNWPSPIVKEASCEIVSWKDLL